MSGRGGWGGGGGGGGSKVQLYHLSEVFLRVCRTETLSRTERQLEGVGRLDKLMERMMTY